MGKLPGNVLTDAFAPTELPIDVAGSTSMYFKPSYETHPIMGYPGFQSNYSVLLSAPTHPLASFTGAHYDTAAHADGGFVSSVGNQPVPSGAQAVNLGYGITAKQYTDATLGVIILQWQEGRWTVRVSQSGKAPKEEASAVAQYMHEHVLPVPSQAGVVSVTESSAGVKASVGWTEGQDIYVVQTQPGTTDPAWTAMGMAISMHAYK